MSLYKRIFIIGHPGAGKGVLAKALAEKIGWQFVDADLGLEFHVGRSLSEMMGNNGRDAFYDCLFEIAASLLAKENIVVTTDAGIACDERIRKLLAAEFIVYLKVSAPVQIERIARNPAPLILNTDIRAFIDKLHDERDGLYEQMANLTINGDDSELEEHVRMIIKTMFANQETNEQVRPFKLENKDLIIFHKKSHVPVRLTEQQAVCLKLLVQGKTSKEIARDIHISYRTVEGHIAKAMEMSGCSSSKELIALYHDLI